MTVEKNILEINDLYKTYHIEGAQEVRVLKGIHLELKEGEIVTIYGPSGVGKSTLLHIIGALDRPTKGKVKIDSKNIFSLTDTRLAIFRNRTIGFVFQFHHLLPEFSALENVMMPGMIARQNREEVKKQAIDLLKSVGLAARLDHRPRELSGGEQQRVAVARALVNNPKLLLADEPSGNLDMRTADALHELLWSLSRDYKKTLVIVTHNPDLATHSDRVIKLLDGKVKSDIKSKLA
jgi:lipoprotein-releasing system ATP-binding protein